jgi:HAD superfamily hydrolase (TIGR01509 family)
VASSYDLVIFDCDGVLVDSERIANEVFRRILTEETGIMFSLEQMFDTFVGHSQAHCMEKLEKILGYAPPDLIAERYNQEINQTLSEQVEAVQGIHNVLIDLPLPYCVASSGSYEKMELTLGKTGLKRFFGNNIYSTSDVSRGKPHPDIYLHAAKLMGVDVPRRCLVIEDSPVGVTGAIAAGMTVFGFAELMPREKLLKQGAHLIFDKMENLPDLIAQLIEPD